MAAGLARGRLAGTAGSSLAAVLALRPSGWRAGSAAAQSLALPPASQVEKEFLSQPGFNADAIRSKSSAAAGLCAWVVNICKYFRIYEVSACALGGAGRAAGAARP